MLRKSGSLRIVLALFWLTGIGIPAAGSTWTQTDWSGGSGQLSWSDTTMYYTGAQVDGWRFPGDLKLNAPDDSDWFNTGDLAGATAVYSLAQASNGVLYAGTDGAVFKSGNGGITWSVTGDLTGATAVLSIIEASGGVLYAGTGPNGDVFRYNAIGGFWLNTADLAGATQVYSIIDASGGVLYAGTGPNGHVFESANEGASWSNTGELAGATQVYSVMQASSGFLYAGTEPNGDVFVSTSAGTTWVNSGDLYAATHVYSIIEASWGHLYAGTAPLGDVFRSTNQGSSWQNTGDLSNAATVLSVIEATDGPLGVLYAGASQLPPSGAVFKSTNRGSTWFLTLGADLGIPSVMQALDGTVYAAVNSLLGIGSVYRAGFFSAGYLVSSVYETEQSDVFYGVMTWEETLNGQTIVMKVRTDVLPDMSTAPDWVACPPVVNGQDISELSSVDDEERYVQYRAELFTSSQDVTPLLHEVAIDHTFKGPVPDSAIACDGTSHLPGIDDDDYVFISFDEPTNRPYIDALSIDSVLALSGGHSWLDGFGDLDTTYWSPTGDMVVIELSVFMSPPTVAVGDTITPDGLTITDPYGNPCTTRVVIGGSFDPPGVEEPAYNRLTQTTFALSGICPNPSSEITQIGYQIPVSTDGGRPTAVSLKIYDTGGRLVRTLVDEPGQPGYYSVRWDGSHSSGRKVPTGIYFCKLTAGDLTVTRKLVLLR